MSDTIKLSPGLLSMPNEVLANICTFAVDDSDGDSLERRGREWLRAVRLTCKQLYQSATTELAERFLTTLLDSSLRGGGLQDIREARSRLQASMDFLEEEVELIQRTGIFWLLVKALRTIRGYGHSVSLAVFNYPYTCPQMLGYQEAIERISEDSESPIEDALTRDGVRSSFRTLLSAAAWTECCVEGLSLEVNHAWCETVFSQRNTKNDFCLHTPQVFLNVKVLDLSATAELFRNDLGGLMRKFLSLTKNLETLYLYNDCDDGKAKSLGRAIGTLQSNRLHLAQLGGAVCARTDLVSFLDRHRSTLKKLCLYKSALQGSWEEVMIWIRDNCSLTCLGVRNLYECDKNEHEVLWTTHKCFRGGLAQLTGFLNRKREEQAELEGED